MPGIPTVGDLVYQGVKATDAVYAAASDEIAVIVRGLPETIGERDRLQAINQIDNVLDRSFGRTPQRAKASDLYDAIVTTRNAAVNAPYDKAAAYISDVLQNTGLYRGLYGPVVQAQRANQAALFDAERRWVREDGYRLSDRVWRQGRRMREQIDTVIRDGIREGIGAEKLARRLEQYIDPSHAATTWTRKGVRKRSVPQRPYAASSARRLARTEIMHAYGMATIQSTKDTPGAVGIQWRTSGNHPNPDECDVHASRDGYRLGRGVYPADEVPRYPEHPNCIPAGTLVDGPPVAASYARWYDGEVIEITTERGHFLTVTPNHPVLTSEGWIAAGLLLEGDQLISEGWSQRGAATVPNDHDRPAVIEQVAEAIMGTGSVTTESVPSAAEQFHGDGSNGEVQIVRANGLLLGEGDTTRHQPFGQQCFRRTDAQLALLASDGALNFPFNRIDLSTSAFMGGGGHGGALLIGHASDAKCDLFAHRSPFDAVLGEDANDGSPASGMLLGDHLFASTLPVHLDHVVSVNVRAFAGHVYNLSTRDRWYTANGIIVHNCLCTLLPVMPSREDVLDAIVRDIEPEPDVAPVRKVSTANKPIQTEADLRDAISKKSFIPVDDVLDGHIAMPQGDRAAWFKKGAPLEQLDNVPGAHEAFDAAADQLRVYQFREFPEELLTDIPWDNLIIGGQDDVAKFSLRYFLDTDVPAVDAPPIVIKSRGAYYVQNGNHRAVVQRVRHENLRAVVFDADDYLTQRGIPIDPGIPADVVIPDSTIILNP